MVRRGDDEGISTAWGMDRPSSCQFGGYAKAALKTSRSRFSKQQRKHRRQQLCTRPSTLTALTIPISAATYLCTRNTCSDDYTPL